jgi:hypothetical protein
VLVVLNVTEQDRPVVIRMNGELIQFEVKKESIATALL